MMVKFWKLDTSPISHSITKEEIQKILGKSFSNQEITSAISRMWVGLLHA